MKRKYVQQPVVHLRREPIPFAGLWKDPLQETQCLYGDPVDVLHEEGKWCYVRVPEQQKFDLKTGEWIGYPGWIESECLTEMPPSHLSPLRPFDYLSLMAEARTFLGTPYLWGGASHFNPTAPMSTGVDCSGLVYLLHKIHGVILPRDAHDQWKQAKAVPGHKMTMGDLVFIELKEKPGRIDHVMLYDGDGMLIEAVINPGIVREIPVKERIGIQLQECLSEVYETPEKIFRFSQLK